MIFAYIIDGIMNDKVLNFIFSESWTIEAYFTFYTLRIIEVISFFENVT